MRTFLIVVGLVFSAVSYAQNEPFTKRVVATGFNSAWEVVYGPNDSLWVTENRNYTIQRVNIANGNKTQLIDIKATDGTINLPSTGQQAQGGLMGMALHPNLYSSDPAVRALKPWVYVVYVYRRNSCPGTQTSCVFTTKIVRYTYSGNSLTSPLIILDNIPGSNDHNSGRLVLSPVMESGQYRLYYTLGDMGSGRDKNLTRTQNSLNLNSLEGKVIRLNSEDDGDAGADAWVPDDNPFYNSSSITARDYVYSYGHRNPQGLAWGYNGSGYSLYSSEQMDKTDDEVNLIQAGRNYGWDSVAGYCDDNVNGTRIGQTLSANESSYCTAHAEHTEPLYTLYTATAAEVATMPVSNSLWPTAALSSIDHYALGIIPGWNYSVLVSPLKENLVYRLQLNANGTAVVGDTISYFRGDGNRVRRIRVAPDGMRFYVARDVGASANGGAIMEYRYDGVLLKRDTLPRLQRQNIFKQLTLHPNPAGNIVTIDYPRSFAKPAVVELYTIDGVRVMGERSFNSQVALHIGHLRTGVYLVKITNGVGQLLQVRKLIKK
ncbi:MAG: PQQ-dependent sugar dehydrogenase [Chitinophagaceae bacterium]|nr:PQQ-dependent sugar dehydrogenase [Chitinophagaceae bacterium]